MTYKQAMEKFKTDFRCYKSKEWKLRCVFELMISPVCRYMFTGRLSECGHNNPVMCCGCLYFENIFSNSLEDSKWGKITLY